MRYTPWVVSEHVPDYSTLENLVRSERFAGKTGQDLAIALWGLMVDRDLGIFHYFPALEAFSGREVFDPLKVFNVYGFTICHIHAHNLAMLCRAAGLPARIADITGHEGTEVFYDGRWHYFDADIQMFHRLRPPDDGIIASREDLYRDPTLVSDQPNPSHPYHFPDRLPETFWRLYTSPPRYREVQEDRVHSMDFRLRPGEEMVRYFHNRGRWVSFASYPAAFKRYPSETGPEGPTERFWPRRQWGNGFFRYAPRLTRDFRDAELGADEMTGLTATDAGLEVEGDAGEAVFAFESPYVYCGIPDPLRRVPPADGATVKATFNLPPGATAQIEIAPEHDAFVPNEPARRRRLWASVGNTGKVEALADFTEHVEGTHRFRMRIALTGRGARMETFQTQLWFMVSPHSLPALRNRGDNRMRLHSNDQYGLPTRTLQVEHLTSDADFPTKVHATANLRHQAGDFVRLYPVDPSRPWEVVYELAAPRGGKVAWVSALGVIEGRKPDERYDGTPARIEIADSPGGAWQTVAERQIVEDPNGWHFVLFGHGRFSGGRDKGYVRFSAKKGAHAFRVAGHYVPAGEQPRTPLEIEHFWYEVDPRVGRRLRSHREVVEGEAREYVVRCAEEPHDERIELRVPSLAR
jgi:hypothetical protein